MTKRDNLKQGKQYSLKQSEEREQEKCKVLYYMKTEAPRVPSVRQTAQATRLSYSKVYRRLLEFQEEGRVHQYGKGKRDSFYFLDRKEFSALSMAPMGDSLDPVERIIGAQGLRIWRKANAGIDLVANAPDVPRLARLLEASESNPGLAKELEFLQRKYQVR